MVENRAGKQMYSGGGGSGEGVVGWAPQAFVMYCIKNHSKVSKLNFIFFLLSATIHNLLPSARGSQREGVFLCSASENGQIPLWNLWSFNQPLKKQLHFCVGLLETRQHFSLE